MRLSGCVAGLAMIAALTGAQAADYGGPYAVRRGGYAQAFIGECVRTRVATVGLRPGAGEPVIAYADGVVQAYDAGMLGQAETYPGDPIQLCLVSFSRDCGAEDLPGRTYATGNLRTGAAWTQPDIRSSCTPR